MDQVDELSYGIYGQPAWFDAARSVCPPSVAQVEVPANGASIVFELDSYPLLGGLKVAVPSGHGRTGGIAPIPKEAQLDPSWLGELLDHLAEKDIDLAYIPRLWQTDAQQWANFAGQYQKWSVSTQSGPVLGIHQIGDSLDETLSHLSKNERKSIRRRYRRVLDSEDLEIRDITDPDELNQVFQVFKDLHTSDWHKRGRQGHYIDWPEATKFHETLIDRSAHTGEALITGLWSSEGPVAMQLGFVTPGLASATQLAHATTSPQFDALSPSVIAYFRFVEFAIKRGIRTIDIGLGSYDYKHRLGGIDVVLHDLILVRNQSTARARAAVARRVKRFLDYWYYRVWFLRLSSKLRVAPGPLLYSWRRLPR